MSYMRHLLIILFIWLLPTKTEAVTASFTVDFAAGCAPHVVHFTNTSTGATSYSWNLGNSTVTSLTNPSTSYLSAGTYTVTLTATGGGATSTYSMVITVYPLPTVSFFATATMVCPGAPVSFTSTSTPGVPGSMTYLWNFGDGTTSTAVAPVHAYNTSGTYNVTLAVTNSQGCVKSYTMPAYITVFPKPVAGFTGSPLVICNPPGTVTFTSLSTGTAPLSHLWTFGVGSTSVTSPATFTYTTPGTYAVKLLVTDGNGCKDSVTIPSYIYVGALNASFTSPTAGCVGTTVTFSNTSTPHGTRTWTYGDGSPADTSYNGMHIYTATGTYTVTLTVHNGPCTSVFTRTIIINPLPTGSFTIAPAEPCPAPVTINYTGTVPAGSTVMWLYEGGTTGAGLTGSHTYSANGVKTIKMVITDVNGCRDTVVKKDTIYGIQFIAYAIPKEGCVPLTVNFSTIALTYEPDSMSHPYPYAFTGYTWTYGDGSAPVTGATPVHTYTSVGTYVVSVTATTTNGCTFTDSVTVRVGAPPVVTFTATPAHICYGDVVTFTATVISGPVTEYWWYFGEGTATSVAPTIGHQYILPGTFSVTVIPVYNGCPGPPYVSPITIRVDSPKAIIHIDYVCSPVTRVVFGDSSLGDDTHLWLFGDGTTSTLDNPIHDYPSVGSYTVTLATYNATSGCRDTAYAVVNLSDPVVDFSADDTTLCEGGIALFTAHVTGGSISDPWWYINGITHGWQSGLSQSDTFASAGLYTVMFTYVNPRGCADTVTKVNYIIVGKPLGNFTVSPPSGCAPLTVTFTDISTDVPGLFMSSFTWSFGDGTGATVTTPTTTHTYTAAGTYNVTEYVTDNIGCRDTTVRPAAVRVYRPHAVFSVSDTHPCKYESITFTSSSTGVVGWLWLFGDGGTASGATATHAYTAAGTYTARLVVTDSHGCTDTATYVNYITITQPVASFSPSDTFSVCAPLTVSFANATVGGTAWSWDFGDGNVSALHSPSNVYIPPGLYTVRLIASDAWGCADTAIRTVNIYGYAGSLSYTPLYGCVPLQVHFHAAISNVPHIIWDFGDGSTSVLSAVDSAVHIYTIPGAFVPKLILSDNTGCQNSTIGPDTIKVDQITAKFDVAPAACLGTPFNFVDSSTWYWMPVNSWIWTYNGNTSTLSSPGYQINTLGSFPVSLTVSNVWGCTATVSGEVEVRPLPVVTTNPDTVVCVGDPATLMGYGAVAYEWSPTATLSCVTCSPTEATPPEPTTYTVIGTDAWGCKDTADVQVKLRTHTIANAWGDTTVCFGTTVPMFDTGGHRYTWLPPGGLNNSTVWNPLASPGSTVTYTVIAQLGGCIPDTDYVKVTVNPQPTVDAGADVEVLTGTSVRLNATGLGVVAFQWMPPTGLSCADCQSPEATVGTTTTYVVAGISAQGCRDYDTVTLNIFCNSQQVFLPNTFTPNGDGKNDVFYPRSAGISLIKSFRIYNRWGELLFERSNIEPNDETNAWDGSYKGEHPRSDVFVYVVEAVCSTGQPILIKGDVTIVR